MILLMIASLLQAPFALLTVNSEGKASRVDYPSERACLRARDVAIREQDREMQRIAAEAIEAERQGRVPRQVWIVRPACLPR